MKKIILLSLVVILLTAVFTSCEHKPNKQQFDADSLSAQITNSAYQQITNPSFKNVKEFGVYRDSIAKIELEKQIFIKISKNAFEQCSRVVLSKNNNNINFQLFMKEYEEGYDNVYKYLQEDSNTSKITMEKDSIQESETE